MREALDSWGAVIVASAAGLPAVLCLVALLARRRGRTRAAAEVGMVAGTLPWVWMVMTPRDGPDGIRLVPLRDLISVIAGEPGTALVQVVGNLLVFAALGFLLPVRFPVGPAVVAATAGAGSLAIETSQWALGLGRVSSVDDVLLNTAGAVLAAAVSHPLWARRRAAVRRRSR